jgi:hypothetical protein
MAVFSVRAFLCRLISARDGGYKGIPSGVRKDARRLLKHFPVGSDLLQPEAFCRDTIQRWATEMDRNWRCDETSMNASNAQRNVTEETP